MKKQNKGITLIALVITIIVLLILAGITITLVMGDNGLIAKSQQAGKNYAEAENYETNSLNSLEDEMIAITNRGDNTNQQPDYNNIISLTDKLATVNQQYIVPDNGIIHISTYNTSNGDGYYVVALLDDKENNIINNFIYQRDSNALSSTTSEVVVNKGQILRLIAYSNRSFYDDAIYFIPFK